MASGWDETEVTNSKYKQFVEWVHDSILRTRLADPAYGGDETYMITEDKNGNPVTPHLNWNKRLPRNPMKTNNELLKVYIQQIRLQAKKV